MENFQKSLFVISLDFELLWGVFDKVDPEQKRLYFQNTRNVIPDILELFEEYDIHATWAIVGMLFNDNWVQWKDNLPEVLPNYKEKKLSGYRFAEKAQIENLESMVFAKDLIEAIKRSPGQEIGTHTYSHYYCLEEGQTISSFRADLAKAVELAKELDIELKSLIFPRNQFNKDYLKVCSEFGIENVRSNPTNWYWENTQQETFLSKIFRTGDAYFGFNNKSYFLSESQIKTERPLKQKASRLLRPYTSNKTLNYLKLKRIKTEMTTAAKNGEIYHLWWHPHNFGNNPQENLRELREILDCYKTCKENYGFVSCSMKEVRDFV